MTRVLVTNDDGIDAPGLHVLAAMAVEQGFDVVVAAPMTDASGSGAALTAVHAAGRIVAEQREVPGLAHIRGYAVAAAPALIVLIATRVRSARRDLVLSGINRGANVGRAVLHSGTVGAALTASAHGCRALAVSLAVEWEPDATECTDPHWSSAARVTAGLLPEVLGAEPGAVLNLNVPDLAYEKLGGLRRATLAAFGVVQTKVEAGDGFVRLTIVEEWGDLVPGTDAALLSDGFASVTTVRAVTEA